MNKIGIMNYEIDITELNVSGAKFTSCPETKRERKYYLYLDQLNNRWDLFLGHRLLWEEDALLTGRTNINTCVYKLLPKVLRFINDRDHEKMGVE